MGSNNDKPDIRPAIAGDVETYDNVEALAEVLRSEHAPNPFAEAGVFSGGESLVADGTAAKLLFNPDLLTGDLELCRPFPGITVALMHFKAVDAEAMREIARRALPQQDEIVVRFVHQGNITYHFGDQHFRSGESPGVVSCRVPQVGTGYDVEDGEDFVITMISFTEEGEREVWHRLGIPPSPLFQQLRSAPDDGSFIYKIPDTELFRQLSRSFLHLPRSGFAHTAMSRLKVGELFCLLGEYSPAGAGPVTTDVPFSEVRKLSQARALLEENTGAPPSISELSAMVGLNRRKLTEGFKKVFGETVAGYALELRMRRGYQLLKESRLPITEIAESCGYEHANNFTLAFRRRFGCSPSKVRQQK